MLRHGLLVACLVGCSATSRNVPPPQTRVLPVREITEYSQATSPEIYLRTTQDVLPGGLAAAMAPILVDWEQSDPRAEGGSYVIRNLNEGGNPLGGTTVLRSARIPADRIERAEFILVPLDPMGVGGAVAHGMLRFVFSKNRPGRLLGPMGDELGAGSELEDLILSWEAWRPPGVDFDFIKGMDAKNFGLSLRAYSGRQRFLEDALGKRDWYAYELSLPGAGRGVSELLYDTLALGDGTGRHVLAEIFSQEADEWLSHAPGGGDDPALLRARWEELMTAIRDFDEPEDGRLRLEKEDRNYQTIRRSCSTLALYCINVATERLLQQGLGSGQGMKPTSPAIMEPVAPRMTEMAHMTTWEIFLVAPKAVDYLIDNVTVIPTKVPRALEQAGLLAGDAKAVHYSLAGTAPYGDLRSILIR
jgi:hypothetical protein